MLELTFLNKAFTQSFYVYFMCDQLKLFLENYHSDLKFFCEQ